MLVVLGLFSLADTPVVYANSAEPPSIVIIVPNAPQDLEIGFVSADIQAQRTDKSFESYYTFYSHELKYADYAVRVTTGDTKFELLLEPPPKLYNNVYTLDLGSQTLTPGKSMVRSLTLISLRIFLTLLIEAIIFYLFGFRRKKSWLIFLIINLLTQIGLNFWLIESFSPLGSPYIIFSLIIVEILIFIVEIAAFLRLVNEHSNIRVGSFVVTANLLSLILGGYLIMSLPI